MESNPKNRGVKEHGSFDDNVPRNLLTESGNTADACMISLGSTADECRLSSPIGISNFLSNKSCLSNATDAAQAPHKSFTGNYFGLDETPSEVTDIEIVINGTDDTTNGVYCNATGMSQEEIIAHSEEVRTDEEIIDESSNSGSREPNGIERCEIEYQVNGTPISHHSIDLNSMESLKNTCIYTKSDQNETESLRSNISTPDELASIMNIPLKESQPHSDSRNDYIDGSKKIPDESMWHPSVVDDETRKEKILLLDESDEIDKDDEVEQSMEIELLKSHIDVEKSLEEVMEIASNNVEVSDEEIKKISSPEAALIGHDKHDEVKYPNNSAEQIDQRASVLIPESLPHQVSVLKKPDLTLTLSFPKKSYKSDDVFGPRVSPPVVAVKKIIKSVSFCDKVETLEFDIDGELEEDDDILPPNPFCGGFMACI